MAQGIFLVILGMIIMLVKYIYRRHVANKVEDLVPVINAVINHGKDTVNNYVEKHQTTTSSQSLSNTIIADTDQMYEQAMEEIEKGTVQKALYARAFSQCEGDKDKTDALYIKLRVQAIQEELKSERVTSAFSVPVISLNDKPFINDDQIKNIQDIIVPYDADKRTIELKQGLSNYKKSKYYEKELKKEQAIEKEKEEKQIHLDRLSTFGIPKNLKQKIENDGYSFLSKLTVREQSTWNDYDFFIETDRVVFKNRVTGKTVKEYIFDLNDFSQIQSVPKDDTDRRIDEIQRALKEHRER